MTRPMRLASGDRAWLDTGLGVLALALMIAVIPAGWRPLVRAAALHGAPRSHAGSPLLRAVHLGLYPFSVLVDTPTKRVFAFAQAGRSFSNAGPVDVIKVLDAATGTVLHTARVGVGRAAYFVGATVDSRGGHVLLVTATAAPSSISTAQGTVRILDGRTGAVVRAFPAGMTPQAVAMDGVHRVFVLDAGPLDQSGAPAGNATLRVFDASTGRAIRAVAVGRVEPNGAALVVDERTSRVFITENEGVRVLDATTGTTIARVPIPSISTTVLGLAVDERAGRVIVGGRDNFSRFEGVTMLDARTGKALQTADGAGEAMAVDAADGRVVAVNTTTASDGGDIGAQVVDIASGRVVSTPTLATGLGFSVTSAVYKPRHRAIVAISEGTTGFNVASVLDTHSGLLVRQVRLGIGPPSVAIDAQTGRAFVANGGDATVSVLDATRL